MDADDARSIGARARIAGISKSYLGMLEHGQRGFNRRGLVEDLANALGCSVADLTGQPYLPPDRESALAKAVIAQIERGLNEATLDDAPDLQPRPLDVLDDWARSAMELRDTASYRPSGEGIDDALIELHVHLATSDGRDRLRAADLLTQTAYHAFVLATTFGYLHLAQLAAQRCFEAARIAERPELEAFAMFARAPSVARTGGRHRAVRMLDRALDDAQQLTTIRDGNTLGAETFGLLHLMGAHFAARNSDADALLITSTRPPGSLCSLVSGTGCNSTSDPPTSTSGASLSVQNLGKGPRSPSVSSRSRSTLTLSAARTASLRCTST
ncbi:MAG: helix-turn-helix transcriptional regulator, partial [Actinobacteria bacterium]|nr:helix-turn-helix transcriptional regulator [Actinomycetota bacterium]